MKWNFKNYSYLYILYIILILFMSVVLERKLTVIGIYHDSILSIILFMLMFLVSPRFSYILYLSRFNNVGTYLIYSFLQNFKVRVYNVLLYLAINIFIVFQQIKLERVMILTIYLIFFSAIFSWIKVILDNTIPHQYVSITLFLLIFCFTLVWQLFGISIFGIYLGYYSLAPKMILNSSIAIIAFSYTSYFILETSLRRKGYDLFN